MSDDLTGLGPRGFERLCRALATYVLGPGIEAFGSGPDGGREASFRGLQQYPSSAEPWNGYGIVQAKYKERLLGTGADTTWLRRHVKAELDAWADPARRRVADGQRPEYLIFATNVPLSSVPGSGGRDRISQLIGEYATVLGLKDWRVWDAAQISMFLDAYPEVRCAFAALITPSEVLADMRDQLGTPPELRVVLNVPTPVIQPGQPGSEAAFGEAYATVSGEARLGKAVGEVREEGPGWVQYFSGDPGGDTAVICACYGRPAIAVSGQVWRALAGVGGLHPGGGPIGAGLPVSARPPGLFIDANTHEIELADGKWGPGWLVRVGHDEWVWRPEIAFDSEACRDRDRWAARDGQMDLKLRVAARIPAAAADHLRVTNSGRARMLAALRTAGLGPLMLALAGRYGLDATGPDWAETPEPTGYNNSRFAAYQRPVSGAEGKVALLGSAWFSLPGSYSDALSCVVDLRFSFDAIRPTLAPAPPGPAHVPADLRVTRGELTEFFAHAWQVTTMILPLLITTSPAELQPSGAPRLELHIQNERPEMAGHDRSLRTLDMVDLTDYGQPRRHQLRDLSVGITTPIGLPESRIAELVSNAMVRMTEDFGFTGTRTGLEMP